MKLHEFTAERGRKSLLALRLRVPPQLVGQWANGVRPVPRERAPEIEFATDGSVTVEEIPTGANWVRTADPSWPHPSGRPLLDVARAAVEA